MNENSPALVAESLLIGYRNGRVPARTLGDPLTLSLYPGELVCLLGPNGVGKSTLLRTLMGMQSPLAGQVALDGQDIRRFRPDQVARRMSIVLTDRASAGLLTAYELVALGRGPFTSWLGNLTPRDHMVVRDTLEAVGAEGLAGRLVDSLSDGERQKVYIARALAQEPGVMLLDEPTAFLDLPHRVEIMALLRRIAHQDGRAVLLSTHDLDQALRAADRIWLMNTDGRLVSGAPEDLVLNGGLEGAFTRRGLTFDEATGSFTPTQAEGQMVSLHGEGISAHWTARALERGGFTVSRNGGSAPIRVEVLGVNGSACWRCQRVEASQTFSSLYDLIAALRADFPGP